MAVFKLYILHTKLQVKALFRTLCQSNANEAFMQSKKMLLKALLSICIHQTKTYSLNMFCPKQAIKLTIY